ncbi:hypothetical protein IEQ34_005411 [Dendrobium chrysotoxum]|uniref:Peptidase S8/S53 domain-containing protein n=1 Tax=Dendrobium chrysotoxum TaxID=161865 RepID=A0AAV7HCK2_DENCH|nr:hypothetical protein IEQ34_005411 [Dendrobium chrysotoxum]
MVSVFPSKQRQLRTTRSWNFMGFPSTAPRIWPESKSFDDVGYGVPPSKWKGIPSPRGNEGHETLTSSTATNASLAGIVDGTACGCVPSTRITVYKVCWSDYCSNTNILTTFEVAIVDGIDIITLSIGGDGAINYFVDDIAIGSFHAMKKNILSLSSVRNSSPGSFSIENYAPWQLTVEASTIYRKIVAQAKLGNGEEFHMHPLIFGENAPNILAGANSSISNKGTLNKKLVKGKVVYCSSLSDGSGSLLAGAIGEIMQTDGANDISYEFSLPVSMLRSNSSEQVLHYANKTRLLHSIN